MSTDEYPIRIHVASDVGKVRKENQDSYFVGPHPPERVATHGVLILVADGMGGHAAGRVASTLAVETVFSSYYTDFIGLGENPLPALRRAFQSANLAIIEAGRRDHRHFGMGTTCSALLLRGEESWICHVGDSRIYRYRDAELACITRDHTLLQQMIDKGELEARDAGDIPISHILVRAMGSEERVELDSSAEPLSIRPGDRFLLSSDGLHDLLLLEQIADILADPDGDAVVSRLAATADAAGAPDNVTAILVEVPGPVVAADDKGDAEEMGNE